MIIIYCENNANQINRLCGQNAKFYDILSTAEVETKPERMITPLKFEINVKCTSEFRRY
jgi:hypothetical protein